jgi:hypothetical protein
MSPVVEENELCTKRQQCWKVFIESGTKHEARVVVESTR